MPLSYEDETNIEDEGMIGKIVNVARMHHKDAQENQEKMKKQIEAMQEKVDQEILKVQEK